MPSTYRRSTLIIGVSVAIAALALAVAVWGYIEMFMVGQRTPIDLLVYYRTGQFVASGESPYSPAFTHGSSLPWAYTPFAALLMVPLTWIPMNAVHLAWSLTAVVIPAIVIAVLGYRHVIAPITRRWMRGIAWIAVTIFAVFSSAVIDAMSLGQIGTLLAALTLFDLLAPTAWRGFGRFRLPQGVLVGIAGAIKLVPLIAIPYWVITKQWKPAVTSAVTVGIVWSVSWLILPAASLDYFFNGGLLSAQKATGADIMAVDNQSLQAVLMRALGSETIPAGLGWAASAVALLIGLILARRLYQLNSPLAAATVVGLSSILASPISWVHHTAWVILIPAALLTITPSASSRASTELISRHPGRILTAALFALLLAVPAPQYSWSPLAHTRGDDNYLAVAIMIAMLLMWRFAEKDASAPGLIRGHSVTR